MSGTGFLDDFKEKKGNYEPPTKVKQPQKGKKPPAATPRPFLAPVVQEEVRSAVPDDVPIPVSEGLSNVNPAVMRMIASARAQLPPEHRFVFCGISGPPKSGKSGGPLDSRTPAEIENGAEILHIDFDMGGITTVAAHHADKPGILVLNPWVFNFDSESTDSYDFPATFQKTIDILQAAQAQTESQRAYYAQHGKMPTPYLKTVVFDGADQWLHICETCMKIKDLDLGVDGLEAAVYLRQHEKGDSKKKSVSRFNWNLRTIRYSAALFRLRELCRNAVHCYIITHMKPGYDSSGNEISGADVPRWHRDSTEAMLQQTVYTSLEEERNENGELTGVVKAYGTVVSNRTSLNSPERFLIFERNSEGGVWHGWPNIAEGDFTGGGE